MFIRKAQAGFTLVEVIVAVSIIVIMLSVLLFSIVEIRKNSRDKQRVADLAQLEFALTAYREVNRDYPSFDAGIAVGKGEAIDAVLAEFWQMPTVDPVNDATYEYVYDSDVECQPDERYVAIIASNFEREDGGNASEVCPGLAGYDNAYIILIDGPIVPGSSPDISSIDDEGSWWNDPANRSTIDMDAYQEALAGSQNNNPAPEPEPTPVFTPPTLLNGYCPRTSFFTRTCYYSDNTSCSMHYLATRNCTTW